MRREVMTVEYVNIMEAAQRCGISDKTIRRWIHAGKLPARFPLVNTSSLPFFPHAPSLLRSSNTKEVCQWQSSFAFGHDLYT
jgi:transposase